MSSRVVQLVAKGLTPLLVGFAVLMAPLGDDEVIDRNGDGIIQPEEKISEEHAARATEWAATAALLLVALGTFASDLLIHRLQNGGILKAAAERGRISPQQAARLKP